MKGVIAVKELVEMLGRIQKVLFEVKDQLEDQDLRISQIEESLGRSVAAKHRLSVEGEVK